MCVCFSFCYPDRHFILQIKLVYVCIVCMYVWPKCAKHFTDTYIFLIYLNPPPYNPTPPPPNIEVFFCSTTKKNIHSRQHYIQMICHYICAWFIEPRISWLVGWLVVFYYYYGATILSLFFFAKLCQFENEFKLTRWKKWFIHCHFFVCLLPYWWFFFWFWFWFSNSFLLQSINNNCQQLHPCFHIRTLTQYICRQKKRFFCCYHYTTITAFIF